MTMLNRLFKIEFEKGGLEKSQKLFAKLKFKCGEGGGGKEPKLKLTSTNMGSAGQEVSEVIYANLFTPTFSHDD